MNGASRAMISSAFAYSPLRAATSATPAAFTMRPAASGLSQRT